MGTSLTEPSDARCARPRRRSTALALAAALAALGPVPAQAGEPVASPQPLAEEARLAEGAIARYRAADRRLELETASGPLTLAIDRDTVVFTARGVGTVRDLAPGLRVRAAWIGAPARAVWLELARPAAPDHEPPPAPPPALPPPPAPGTTSGAPCDRLPCP